MAASAQRALLLLLLLVGAASGAELHAASLGGCDEPSDADGLSVEFYDDECKWISWTAIKKIYPDAAQAEQYAAAFGGIGDKLGVKIGLDGAGGFYMELYLNGDCTGMKMLSMAPTPAGQCGQLESFAFSGGEPPKVRVRTTGKSWLSSTVYLLPEEYNEGSIEIQGVKAAPLKPNCDGANATDMTETNGKCHEIDLTQARADAEMGSDATAQQLAEFIPDRVFAGVTCYDGITRVRGGAADCSGGLLTPKGVPEFAVEVPTVDLPWGQCTEVYVKLHTYATEDQKSLRIVLPVKVSVDGCRLVTIDDNGGVTASGEAFTPLAPVDTLPTLPPTNPTADDEEGDGDEDGGFPVWAIVVIVVVVVGAVAGVAVLMKSRSLAQGQASFTTMNPQAHPQTVPPPAGNGQYMELSPRTTGSI
eukprot:TRINITY_DN186_c0_g1_i4.p2 TRINITY_DN186_c0_g1~~TRINITY_DN186_c0_g1_i4.p2  ORF type:complete len:441 (+),score=129.86 TRINITY_DN186_c0_g1_i4:70-1323(+)